VNILFRGAFGLAAMLCLADAILITASVFMTAHAGAKEFLLISLVVSGVFFALGLLLFATQLRFLALTSLTASPVTSNSGSMRRHLTALQIYLTCLGLAGCAFLAALTYGIIERIGAGSAVFG
jgi:hypothetical protein